MRVHQQPLPFDTITHRARRKLMQGDCLDALKKISSASVDMVFADLPYGVTANKWDTPIDLARLWAELRRIGTSACAFVFTATQPFATSLILSWTQGFRYDLIYEKTKATGFVHVRHMPLRAHEHILLFFDTKARAQSTYTPQMVEAEKPYTIHNCHGKDPNLTRPMRGPKVSRVSTHRHPRSVIRFSNGGCGRMHPTQKPVALLDWLIRTYSNPGDTVLDPAMGSGTTGVSAKLNGRNFIGIEKDAAYFAVANRRIAEAL